MLSDPLGADLDAPSAMSVTMADNDVADGPSPVGLAGFNPEFFVRQHYHDILGREPDSVPDADFSGYNFWLSKLNQFDGNYINAEMVKAFLDSIEYKQRFGR